MGNITDWEKIRRGWCAGVTARELAKENEVSHTAINKRAKNEGWEKVSTQVSTLQKVSTGNLSGNHGKTSSDADLEKVSTPKKSENTPKTKRNSRGGNHQPVNQFSNHNSAALKHGGYARRLLLTDDVIEDAQALTLNDELLRLRAANLTATANVGRWLTEMEDASDERRKALLMNMAAADKAMHRNTARIESLEQSKAIIARYFADTALKKAGLKKMDFDLEQARRYVPLEDVRRELVNKKIQADIDRAGGTPEENVIIIHHGLKVPGAEY